MKVLLIESSQLYLAFLSRLFEKEGLEPVVAQDLTAASEFLARGGIDLVCMNRYVPGGDAMDFVGDVRALVARVPVLMLTSDRAANTRERALAAGITEVLYKASADDMAARIRRFVSQQVRSAISRGRVLYVEDSRAESMVLSRRLERLGLEVDHYQSAEEAMERLEHQEFDLVITDVLLRGEQSGLSLVAHIRGLDGDRSRLPVLTITGFDDVARRIELLRAGTNDYIVKPVIEEELAVRVGNLIANKQLLDKVIAQQAQLHALAITDQLTGCANRRGFREYVDACLAERAHDGAGLLLLDLDHFKQINDRHGHDTGDRVLSAVGQALRTSIAEDDLVSRFGGEEFVVFLPGQDRGQTRGTAERLRRAVARIDVDGLELTASIGSTMLPPNASDRLEEALGLADKAVYIAKRDGRDKVVFRSMPVH
ncbi:MAG: diguanylate cyclase [Pseudomonadota bacterium]